MVVAMANNGIPLPVPPLPATVAITPQGAPIRPQDYFENGRKYHGFRKGKYMWPCDEDEKDRMDIYHKLFSVARRGALHATPFTPNFDPGPRVLDLGTGTGIWAIDMAETNKTGEVQGIDLAWIQPEHIPANLAFHQRDIESPWHGMDLESWDLIHMRMLNGSITNWPDTYFKIFRHLKPNFGWMEQVEIDITPRCDDGTLPSDCKLHHWSRYLLDATQRTYRPMAINPNTRELLASLGFVDIQEQIIRVPLNPWPADPHLKEVGRWYNLGFTVGLEGLTLGPMARMHGWKKPDIDRLVAEVKRDICNRKFHAYNNMHIWIARRPANS